ncbi:MAG: hypothetical protein QM652_00325 [Legionella sp.]|uniref:PGAP1-like alpha/beta domain-containing protein n=1 Tax=Legionella sp. TaxID=459 RepID=UPI0039E2DCBC
MSLPNFFYINKSFKKLDEINADFKEYKEEYEMIRKEICEIGKEELNKDEQELESLLVKSLLKLTAFINNLPKDIDKRIILHLNEVLEHSLSVNSILKQYIFCPISKSSLDYSFFDASKLIVPAIHTDYGPKSKYAESENQIKVRMQRNNDGIKGYLRDIFTGIKAGTKYSITASHEVRRFFVCPISTDKNGKSKNVQLDTNTIKVGDLKSDPSVCNHVVIFNGNAGVYHEALEFNYSLASSLYRKLANKALTESNFSTTLQITSFDYRNVHNSKSDAPITALNELVEDGIAQVQNLLDKGADPRRITLLGNSLGGVVGTLVAEHFHNLGIKVRIYNMRSLSSIQKYSSAVDTLTNFFGNKKHPWNADALAAFNRIPTEDKDYAVIHPPKAKPNAEKKDFATDKTISDYASLYRGLRDQQKKLEHPDAPGFLNKFKLPTSTWDDSEFIPSKTQPHPAHGFDPKKSEPENKNLRNERKFFMPKDEASANRNLHAVSPQELKSRANHEITMQDKIIDFCMDGFVRAHREKVEHDLANQGSSSSKNPL